MSRLIQWVVLLVVAAIWAGAYAATKYLLDYVGPFELLVFRFLPVSIIAILLILIFYRKDAVRLLPKYWLLFLGMAIAWLYGHQYMQILGETVIPSAPAGLIIGTYPVFTVILAAIFLKEKLTKWKIIGGLIAFASTGFLMFQGASNEGAAQDISSSQWITYGLITLVSPIGGAIYTLLAKPFLSGQNRDGVKMDPGAMSMLYMAPCIILLVPMMVATPAPDLRSFDMSFWIVLAFLVIFVTFVAYLGWLWALRHFEASTVSISTYMIPVFGLVYSRLWLNEPMGIVTILGAIGIVAGVLIASLEGK
jgi:drug/metabolite transporter (DMT)-like permease